MTDSPLPTPRRSPDSEPPLPAWMTLPGSLVQPSSPPEEDTTEPPSPTPPPPPDDARSTDGARPADEARSTGGAESADEAGSTADALLADEEVSADGPLSQEADSAPAPDVPSATPDAGPPGAGPAGRGAAEFGATRTADEAGASAAGGASAPEWREADAALGAAPGQSEEGSEEGQERAADGPTLEAALEAILLVVDEPVSEITLAQVLERPTHEVVAALRGLAAEYTAAGRGFDLRDVAGGWRFYTRADCAPLVERFVRDGQQTRLTQAALETLAVVAYRQPVSRARVAAVRGVNSDGVMRTLVARGLVEEAGTDPESQAVLYRTSSYFLERLGLRDLSELPELAPFLPDDVENLEETTK